MPPDPSARTGHDGGPRPQAPGATRAHGRYVIGDEIAAGGMATVHLGRMLGDAGFARTVAIKRLHPQFAKDPEVCAMLLDEGRLAARIHHLNVVTTLDVVASGDELFVVMEYVHGEALSALIRAAVRRDERMPPRIVAAVLAGALRGLHAAHEARDAHGDLLGVVHRDISPQNILVGIDGVARVLDFGIAKAAGRMHVTTDGRIKGKFGYMPPEQLQAEVLDRRADIYAAGVVLWEALVGARLFAGKAQTPDFARLLNPVVEPPSTRVRGLSPAHDAVVMHAVTREAEGRFGTALEMAEALEACGPVAPPAEVGAWVIAVAGELLAERASRISAVESRLMTSIRDSLHLIEASEVRIAKLDGLTGTVSFDSRPTPTALPRLTAGAPPAEQPPSLVRSDPPPSEPPAPVRSAITPGHEAAFPEDPLPGRSSAGLWMGAAVLGAVAIAATFAVIASVPATPESAASTAPAASEMAAADAAEVRSAAAAEPAASTLPATPAAPAAPVDAPAKTSAPQVKVGVPAHAAHRAAAGPAAGEGCSPPFTIDADGHKHYKRECLR
jgi:eukaryotic-like serine/threonine-protein kinase